MLPAGRRGGWPKLGTYLHVQAQLIDARTLMERALAITEAACGPDHPEVATGLNNLAAILQGRTLASGGRL